ncbi:MAG: PPC domain-containing protein [Cyanobacteria bacterium J06627_28]
MDKSLLDNTSRTLSKILSGCSLGFLLFSAAPATAQSNAVHQLGILEADDARFETGNYFDGYEVEGSEGQRVSISLDSSDFDTFLGLFDSDWNLVATNDDAAENNINSYLSTTLPRDDTYTVVATSYEPEAAGDYRMVIRNFSPPQPTATVASENGSGGSVLSALFSIPIVQEMAVDAFFSMFSFGGGSSSSGTNYDHYYNRQPAGSRPSGGMAYPRGSGIHGGGPQHGTRTVR